jgi:hypothetical protein
MRLCVRFALAALFTSLPQGPASQDLREDEVAKAIEAATAPDWHVSSGPVVLEWRESVPGRGFVGRWCFCWSSWELWRLSGLDVDGSMWSVGVAGGTSWELRGSSLSLFDGDGTWRVGESQGERPWVIARTALFQLRYLASGGFQYAQEFGDEVGTSTTGGDASVEWRIGLGFYGYLNGRARHDSQLSLVTVERQWLSQSGLPAWDRMWWDFGDPLPAAGGYYGHIDEYVSGWRLGRRLSLASWAPVAMNRVAELSRVPANGDWDDWLGQEIEIDVVVDDRGRRASFIGTDGQWSILRPSLASSPSIEIPRAIPIRRGGFLLAACWGVLILVRSARRITHTRSTTS